jgi:hypothetical protein
MLIKSNPEHPYFESDPLALTCHPLGKLNTIASMLYAYPKGDFEMDEDTILGASEIIKDAAEEIDFLVDFSNDKWRKDWERIKTLERVLKNFINYLESVDQEPDRKQMAQNLRKQMQ